MIDLSHEDLLPLTAACRVIPPGRNGRRTHLSTLLRWIINGVRAPGGDVVRLEAVRLGGRWLTSAQALQRFGERLTPPQDGAPRPAAPRTAGAAARASRRAAEELERLGL
ncbi:MAG TPA: DUF1580 domain-containing protein [Gemmataceae bacterium]|nr:DUF1580 domain-containing protein [Gemmataceae bacterium]